MECTITAPHCGVCGGTYNAHTLECWTASQHTPEAWAEMRSTLPCFHVTLRVAIPDQR